VPSVLAFASENYAYTNPSVPQVGKRLIMLHGLHGSHTALLAIHGAAQMMTDLADHGWQVVLFELPYTQAAWFLDGGVAYRRAYQAKLEQAMTWADTTLGQVTVTVIGGVSFGGLHALMAPSLHPGVTGYLAVLPVVAVGALTEFAGFSTPAFDPRQDVTRLAAIPGHVEWGTSDTRVDYRLTVELVAQIIQAGGQVSVREWAGLAHTGLPSWGSVSTWVRDTF
jgi:pimeloyl-ACP methyl ester carboxylesterase